MKPQTGSGGGGGVLAGAGSSAKKEKVIPQATAEQLRIAEITNVTSEQDSAELHKKIKNIVEFIDVSQDEAAMALHDCDGDVQEAINHLLESSEKGTGWETSGAKKKKEKTADRREENRRPRENRDGPGRGRGRGQRTSYHDGAAGGPGGGRGRPRGPGRGGPGGREGRSGGGPKGAGRGSDDPDQNQPGWRDSNGAAANNNNSGQGNTSGGDDWETGPTWVDPASSGRKPGSQTTSPGQNANAPLSGQAPAEELPPGHQNDTIGNMGNWDDFKADERNANEWSGPRKERTTGATNKSDWVEAVGDRNSDWKTRQRQQPGGGGPQTRNGPQGQPGTAVPAKQQQAAAATVVPQSQPAVAGSQEQTSIANAHGHPTHSSSNEVKTVQHPQQPKVGTQRVGGRSVVQGGSGRTRVRLPPASKIPQTPVEMPPDHHDMHGNTLDVQFGALSFDGNSYDPITSSQSQQPQPSTVDQQQQQPQHNGASAMTAAGATILAAATQTQQTQPATQQTPQQTPNQPGHVASHQQAQSQQPTHHKPTQPSAGGDTSQTGGALKSLSSGGPQVSSTGGQTQVGGQTQPSMTVPPGLDKAAVSSVGPAQTHKSGTMSSTAGQTNAQPTTGVTSQYHNTHAQSNQQSQQTANQTAASNANSYQQYSANTAYKQQTQNAGMTYLQNLTTGMYNPGHTSAPYGQQATQYGSPNYATSFAGSTVASAGYKGGKESGAVASASVGAVSEGVNSTGTTGSSQYDAGKKSAPNQLQQGAAGATSQTMTAGGLVLQPGQLHGAHMHGPYAHMAGHPGAMQPTLYSYYPHPGQLPPPQGSGAHLAADYSQRDNSSSSANAGAMSASSLLQQHSYDKFVRSQDDSSSAAASQGSSTAGSQSTITATAAYPHLTPYNIYYGGPVVPAPFPHMPFMSAQSTGYPTTGNASTASQASKSSTAYGNSQSAFDYPMGSHMSGPGGDYKYQSPKMMSNTNKYMSAAAGSDRR